MVNSLYTVSGKAQCQSKVNGNLVYTFSAKVNVKFHDKGRVHMMMS